MLVSSVEGTINIFKQVFIMMDAEIFVSKVTANITDATHDCYATIALLNH